MCFQEKHHWRRYIYLWINYALFEELEAEDVERTRQVYRVALQLIPHKVFTFSKVWLLYAYFEVRQKNLREARKTLVCKNKFSHCNCLYFIFLQGTAIGMCPRDKLFRGYIDLEIQLREFDRCRKLYEKFLEFGPENCITWIRVIQTFATLDLTIVK